MKECFLAGCPAAVRHYSHTRDPREGEAFPVNSLSTVGAAVGILNQIRPRRLEGGGEGTWATYAESFYLTTLR